MDQLGYMVYLSMKFLSSSQWPSFRLLSKLLGVNARGPILIVSFCDSNRNLSCLLKKVKERGYLFGFKGNGSDCEGLAISHMLFTDNTLIFCEPTISQTKLELATYVV